MKKILAFLACFSFVGQANSAQEKYIIHMQIITPNSVVQKTFDSAAPYFSKSGETRSYLEMLCSGVKRTVHNIRVYDGLTINALAQDGLVTVAVEDTVVIDKNEEIKKLDMKSCIALSPDIKKYRHTINVSLDSTAGVHKADLGEGYSVEYEVRRKVNM